MATEGLAGSAAAPTIVAILRGLTPARAAEVATRLHRAGLRIIEVPLNSPDPYSSVATIAALRLEGCLVGAGTVLREREVQQAHDAGARLIVAPNTDAAVIRAALRLGMRVMPGFASASEAFAALDAGATELKLFPASSYGPGHLKALRAVLPASTRVLAVGGVGAADVAQWLAAGATGFGFGSELFRPVYDSEDIGQRAERLMRALSQAGVPR
ncbi:MAG TPA: 2-dehydro-3-deoxy-6-phosphogalactonate aldolase [Steroidobacteraceae bacterium]|jgi:2-dehydro-3-deoxyphosphogalactonate aldolase